MMGLLWAVWWLGAARAGERAGCASTLSVPALEREIAAAEATLSRRGPDPLAAWARLEAAAGCAGEPIPAALAWRLHRAAATAMWREERRAEATAAASATGGLDLPEAIAALRQEDPPGPGRALRAGGGWFQVDGIYAERLDPDRAALIQRLDGGGAVIGTWYYLPGGEGSAIPAEIEALLEPEVAQRASGWAAAGVSGGAGDAGGTAGGELRLGLRYGGRAGLLVTAGLGGGAGFGAGSGAGGAAWGSAGLGLAIQGERAGVWIGPAWSLRAGREGPPGAALALAWGPGAEAGAVIGAGRTAGLAWGGAWWSGSGWYGAGGAGVALRW